MQNAPRRINAPGSVIVPCSHVCLSGYWLVTCTMRVWEELCDWQSLWYVKTSAISNASDTKITLCLFVELSALIQPISACDCPFCSAGSLQPPHGHATDRCRHRLVFRNRCGRSAVGHWMLTRSCGGRPLAKMAIVGRFLKRRYGA